MSRADDVLEAEEATNNRAGTAASAGHGESLAALSDGFGRKTSTPRRAASGPWSRRLTLNRVPNVRYTIGRSSTIKVNTSEASDKSTLNGIDAETEA